MVVAKFLDLTPTRRFSCFCSAVQFAKRCPRTCEQRRIISPERFIHGETGWLGYVANEPATMDARQEGGHIKCLTVGTMPRTYTHVQLCPRT
ncbi:hypothetical protein WN55_04808 [Dufourea novaeangliae]|uniref:Uncharacterized protein n=1 Tax=Dufourea novaeangliae TaxID=178035 RepID=A0A154PMM6_DUFNO|nr:hypothetical protein WN55_04808 [Dufourea novaeangliae]